MAKVSYFSWEKLAEHAGQLHCSLRLLLSRRGLGVGVDDSFSDSFSVVGALILKRGFPKQY